MAHFRNRSFHLANLICGKAAVDGYFISPQYSKAVFRKQDDKRHPFRVCGQGGGKRY